jgi:hypothetical protein
MLFEVLMARISTAIIFFSALNYLFHITLIQLYPVVVVDSVANCRQSRLNDNHFDVTIVLFKPLHGVA